ncbi:uncharacterized protein LOC110385577 [Bombyx mori]|uniref:Cuticle protein n=1 Tax=Bombyx mori TaxID=7091 RepID=A0A8R2M4F1_BOMMO|nr:uncharacterized protein LOC110385577 [Bombyx mori]
MTVLLKVSILLGIACAVLGEKKIELQDIEEDNLKSEKETELGNSGHGLQTSSNSETGLIPLEFLKSGLLRYFQATPAPESRYLHQYSVSEAPERIQAPVVQPKPQFGTSATQQAMVGYLSNVPMQIYLVPQYYDQSGHERTPQSAIQYTSAGATRAGDYQGQHEAVQTQTNYIEVPAYVTPTAKTYVPHYTSHVVNFTPRPTVAPQPTVSSVIYRPSILQYQAPAIVAQNSPAKQYYQNVQYTETTDIDEGQEHEDSNSNTHAEVTYQKVPAQEYHRHYPSRTPLREEYRHSTVPELPHPNSLLLKGSPSHIPKALPLYRPITQPVYSNAIHNTVFTPRPQPPPYASPFKRRPTSLLDSYIPSHVQIEYMRRGFAKNPAEAFEALSSGRHLTHSHAPPGNYERGFLPNQMYHTAGGGVTFGHYKRSPKGNSRQQK